MGIRFRENYSLCPLGEGVIGILHRERLSAAASVGRHGRNVAIAKGDWCDVDDSLFQNVRDATQKTF